MLQHLFEYQCRLEQWSQTLLIISSFNDCTVCWQHLRWIRSLG